MDKRIMIVDEPRQTRIMAAMAALSAVGAPVVKMMPSGVGKLTAALRPGRGERKPEVAGVCARKGHRGTIRARDGRNVAVVPLRCSRCHSILP